MSTTDATKHLPPSQSYYSPPVTIVLTILLLIFLFIGFFSIYFCRCFMQNLLYSWYNGHSPSGTPVGPASTGGDVGLDPLTIQSFPTFTYSSIKEFRREKYGLECAICLGEFEDNSLLRLLTSCNHVFHQECIDLWLESHKSCPVCRRSLDMPEKSPDNILELHSNEPLEDHAISITIKDDQEDEKGKEGEKVFCSTSQNAEDEKAGEKFSRSKTTGHSIVTSREGEEDKFTLRLPEHVRAKLIRGHNATKSCTEFGEFESERTTGNGGFAEVSGMSRGDDSKV